MTIEQFTEKLKTSGLPVAYNHFPQDQPQTIPFVCWLNPSEDPLFADGGVYYAARDAAIELYTAQRDSALEAMFEQTALSGCSYTKSCEWLDDEEMHLTVYNTQI
ncbi:MAG: hypothetical protein IJ484_06100 [Oscillospiraceae bacterium]|nr:hypothetical protein [Oscillospiraceae bacterium]